MEQAIKNKGETMQYPLTAKEVEVCVSFLKNKSVTPEIISDLNIKEPTFRTHISRIYKKLDVNNSSELTHALLTGPIIPKGLIKYPWLKKQKEEFTNITTVLLRNFNKILEMELF